MNFKSTMLVFSLHTSIRSILAQSSSSSSQYFGSINLKFFSCTSHVGREASRSGSFQGCCFSWSPISMRCQDCFAEIYAYTHSFQWPRCLYSPHAALDAALTKIRAWENLRGCFQSLWLSSKKRLMELAYRLIIFLTNSF